MTEEAIEVLRHFDCTEDEAETMAHGANAGGRLERGCIDSETAAAVIGMLAEEMAAGAEPARAVAAIIPPEGVRG